MLFRNARARNAHVEATLNHTFPAQVFQAKMRNHHGLSALDYALHLKLDGYHTMFAVFYRHKVQDDHRVHHG